jgi:hypothetical protein
MTYKHETNSRYVVVAFGIFIAPYDDARGERDKSSGVQVWNTTIAITSIHREREELNE